MRPSGRINEGYLKNGYFYIMLYENGTHRKVNQMVHRLIATTFLYRNDKLQVNHKDGNKLNNRKENFEYVTAK